jgi:hypothetical protein
MYGPGDPKKSKPKFELPEGYDTEEQFLREMRTSYDEDIGADKLNRDAQLEDERFAAGDQWTDDVRMRRDAARKPTLTFNRLPAFIAQIVGQRRMNETEIKIVADENSDAAVARVREGLIRNLQKVCRADLAYDNTLQNTVIGGLGNFKLRLDYRSPDVWEQDICIDAIPDPLSVVWDRMCREPTGRDARRCFETFVVPKKAFEKDYPWAKPAEWMTPYSYLNDNTMNGWVTVDDVRIVAYWHMRTRPRVLALMQNGNTEDITDRAEDADTLAQIVQRDDGTPVIREVEMPYAQCYICSALDILEGPYELPISRLPYFRVPGWEVRVGDWNHRWGLVRFLKDPQRLHNYWRSVIAERLMATPKAVWQARAGAVAGREAAYRNSHLSDDPLLIFNDDAAEPPQRIEPAQVQEALIGQAELTSQDLKDISNIHEANLGMPSNEVSGAAIMARQRVSDTGTVIYHDNLNQAIEECGRTCNELIPFVYDTPRIIKVLGPDGVQDTVAINDIGNPDSVDITSGRYAVSVVTGPSYATKRMEAAASMLSTLNVMPQLINVFADLLVEAQDWPMAEKIAERIRLSMDPAMLDPSQVTPQHAAIAQAKQQAGQQAAAVQGAAAQSQIQKTQAETAMNLARARNFLVEAQLAPSHADAAQANTASQIADREARTNIEAVKAASAGA